MRAFVQPRAGTQTFELVQVPVPEIDRDEVLVRVHVVGVGIHDGYFLPVNANYPYPIGIEAAGIVEQVGDAGAAYHVGDRIAFVSSMQPKGGTWAEYAAVNVAALIVPIPAGLSFVEAATVPVAGNTILRVLNALEPRPEGGKLFIAGGSGAIGTLALQLAHARGWHVAASASEPNHDLMLSLGAQLAVDYRDPHWADRIREWAPEGVDAAITVLPGTSAATLPVVRDGGHLISISGDAVDSTRGIQTQTVPHGTDVRAELVDLMAKISAGEMRVEVERVYPFEEAAAALAKVTTRHARGKVVLTLGNDGLPATP